MNESSVNKPALSQSKKLSFAAACIMMPVVVLLLLEGVLRLAGLGGYPPLMKHVADTPKGALYVVGHEKARSYFFANRDRPGYNSQYSFFLPKPENKFRILLAGGSAIQGYPQPRHLAAQAFLEAMLEDMWPGKDVEILNIGTTAAASFPVMEMAIEAAAFDPDLVVVYAGHNEFFGAYGVASINRFIAHPAMLTIHRRLRGLAIVQAAAALIPSTGEMMDRTLMEIMIGKQYIDPDDWSRAAAAHQLHQHIGRVIETYRDNGIPVMVCTLPSNERDLAPIGSEPWMTEGDALDQERLELFHRAVLNAHNNPEDSLAVLESILKIYPQSANVYFQIGNILHALSRFDEAVLAFMAARDLDTMPWRATTESQNALLDTAEDNGAIVCDVEDYFRKVSEGGSIGWKLLDDHVHPSLEGQARLAEAIIDRLTEEDGLLSVDRDAFSRRPAWNVYAEELGDNPFDRYAADHQIRVLFNIPFMKETNPEGWRRFEQRASEFERSLPPGLVHVVRSWQSRRPHAGAMRPLTGMVARELMRRENYEEAMRLMVIAQRSVPPYTSWHMEYVYFELACKNALRQPLTEMEIAKARKELEAADILLKKGFSSTGLTERYAARIHQLLGEYEEAIPFLLAAKRKLGGTELVAADQALFLSLLKIGKENEARALAMHGIKHSGEYAKFYRDMLVSIDRESPGEQFFIDQ